MSKILKNTVGIVAAVVLSGLPAWGGVGEKHAYGEMFFWPLGYSEKPIPETRAGSFEFLCLSAADEKPTAASGEDQSLQERCSSIAAAAKPGIDRKALIAALKTRCANAKGTLKDGGANVTCQLPALKVSAGMGTGTTKRTTTPVKTEECGPPGGGTAGESDCTGPRLK